MPRKKRAALAMVENFTKTAGENARKRQKHDHDPNPKLGKKDENVCPPSRNMIFSCSKCYIGYTCIFNICHERTR
jgi:hypothetical protein